MTNSDFGIPCAPAKIQQTLKALWESDSNSSRASLINLAIYSETSSSLAANKAIVDAIVSQHACRSLIIELDREEKQVHTKAWVNAICNMQGGKSICSDQILFYLSGMVTGRMRNIIFAHTDADLPLVLWWQGELSATFEPNLYSVIDRLIIDSSQWKDPLRSYKQVIRAKKDTNYRLILQDLEWTRTRSVRWALANLFENSDVLALLGQLQHVELCYNPAHRCAALLVLSWIATQAGWSHQSNCQKQSHYEFKTRDKRIISAKLVESQHQAPISALRMFDAASKLIEVLRTDENNIIHTMALVGAERQELRLVHHCQADSVSDDQLLALQLARGSHEALFTKIRACFLSLMQNHRLSKSTR